MPAPSRLKVHTSVVERLLKEEAYLVREYNAADANISKAKSASETLPGNKNAEIYQVEQGKRDTVNVYVGHQGHVGIFERIGEALERLGEEIEKAEERDADAQVESEVKAAKEVVGKAELLLKSGERLQKEEGERK